MSRSAAAWQARLVKAYCSRQSWGVCSAMATARSSRPEPRDEFAHHAERVGLGGGEDLTEQTGPGGDRLAPGVGEHADVDRGHRDADRHLVEPEGGVAGDGDAVVADRGRDEPAGEGVAVDGGDGGARVGEQAHVRRPVAGEPRPDGGRVAGEQPEVLIQIQPRGEPAAGPGQHHGGVRVITFEPVEGVVQVGEEGLVLRVDGVGRHRHHGRPPAALDRPAHVCAPPGPARWIISKTRPCPAGTQGL